MQEQHLPPADVSVILPTLNPSEKFDRVVDGLAEAGFSDIVIVNDGSRDDCRAHFDRAKEKYPQCHILTHDVNRGKGAALRTAFEYLLQNRPDCAGAVTIDGDGQHLTRDILRCAEAIADDDTLIMGCRNFNEEHVPPRSRAGNRITSAVFRLFCGIRLSDTQTGLRGVPAALFPRLLRIRGDRYDYETNMLLELSRQGVKFREIPIETVYEDGNSESHFRPVADSLKIYKFILLYILSSLAGALADLLVFYISLRLITDNPADPSSMEKLAAFAIARAVSSFLNFNLNNSMVFHGEGGYRKTLLRYYALCIPQMLLSWGLTDLLSRMAGTGASVLTTLIKFAVDICLFFISYRIQRAWVFQSGKE